MNTIFAPTTHRAEFPYTRHLMENERIALLDRLAEVNLAIDRFDESAPASPEFEVRFVPMDSNDKEIVVIKKSDIKEGVGLAMAGAGDRKGHLYAFLNLDADTSVCLAKQDILRHADMTENIGMSEIREDNRSTLRVVWEAKNRGTYRGLN